MPEAEDVLLEAAEQATATIRRLWASADTSASAEPIVLDDCRRSIELVVAACFGGHWPIAASDAAPPPSWLARLLGRLPPWDGQPSAQAFTDGARIFLPRRVGALIDPAEERTYLHVTALSLAARLAARSIEAVPVEPMARDVYWAIEAARADARLARDLPGLLPAIRRARDVALAERPTLAALHADEQVVESLVRRLLRSSLDADDWAPSEAAHARAPDRYRGMAPVPHWGVPRPELLSRTVESPSAPLTPGAIRPRAYRRLRARVERRPATDEESDGRSGPFVLPFGDPQHSIQDAAGLRRPLDREQEVDLEALGEELERLGEMANLRSSAETAEVVEAEGATLGDARADSPKLEPSIGLCYPEWDYRIERYRADHCRVREQTAPRGDVEWSARVLEQHRALREELRRRFALLRPRRVRAVRQLEGGDLDLDACVEDYGDRTAGCSGSDRLYVSDPARRRDVSVALLVDASGSTDAWVSGGRAVLDVEKEAALVFCEALDSLGDRYAVYTFSSRGPRQVSLDRVKSFAEPNGDGPRARVAGLRSGSYTRLGAALRHVTSVLVREPSRVRLLFLLSDGKPNDEDEYEGRYGLEDTRRAVHEARLAGLAVYCLTIDREGSSYLPYMFGARGHSVAADLDELPARLSEVYRAITYRTW